MERSFAHVCDTGGARKSWLRGLEDVTKRYRLAAAAHNLGRIMRLLFGIGKPRVLQAPADLALFVHLGLCGFFIHRNKSTTRLVVQEEKQNPVVKGIGS